MMLIAYRAKHKTHAFEAWRFVMPLYLTQTQNSNPKGNKTMKVKEKRTLQEVLKGMFVHDFEERIYNGETRVVYVHYYERDTAN